MKEKGFCVIKSKIKLIIRDHPVQINYNYEH